MLTSNSCKNHVRFAFLLNSRVVLMIKCPTESVYCTNCLTSTSFKQQAVWLLKNKCVISLSKAFKHHVRFCSMYEELLHTLSMYVMIFSVAIASLCLSFISFSLVAMWRISPVGNYGQNKQKPEMWSEQLGWDIFACKVLDLNCFSGHLQTCLNDLDLIIVGFFFIFYFFWDFVSKLLFGIRFVVKRNILWTLGDQSKSITTVWLRGEPVQK